MTTKAPRIAGQRTCGNYSYRIARYPVTNAQYQAFVGFSDYGDAGCWQPGTSQEA